MGRQPADQPVEEALLFEWAEVFDGTEQEVSEHRVERTAGPGVDGQRTRPAVVEPVSHKYMYDVPRRLALVGPGESQGQRQPQPQSESETVGSKAAERV